MKVSQSTRSQTVHSADPFLKLLGVTVLWELPTVLKAYTPKEGESLSGVQGTLPPEPPEMNRGGPILFVFTPSHLRTSYTLSYFTVTVPPLIFGIPKVEKLAPTGEWQFEQGFITVVRIAGLPYYAPPTAPSIFTLKATEAEGAEFAIPRQTQQISLVETITAVPGASIEVELIPYVRVLRVLKPSKFLNEIIGFLILRGQEVVEEGKLVSTAVMVYEQSQVP